MDIVDRINTLCESNGTNKNAVEKACGLSHGAIEKWRTHSPQFAGVVAVARHFNVTIDSLTDYADATRDASHASNPQEQWILDAWRALDPKEHEAVAALMQTFLSQKEGSISLGEVAV